MLGPGLMRIAGKGSSKMLKPLETERAYDVTQPVPGEYFGELPRPFQVRPVYQEPSNHAGSPGDQRYVCDAIRKQSVQERQRHAFLMLVVGCVCSAMSRTAMVRPLIERPDKLRSGIEEQVRGLVARLLYVVELFDC
jgi:hypothetical protein